MRSSKVFYQLSQQRQRSLSRLAVPVCSAFFLGVPLQANAGPDDWPYVEQIFVGVHDHATKLTSSGIESGTDISFEAKFRAPQNKFWETIGSPRPHLGGMVNLGDQTDQIYGGVTYRFRPFENQFLDVSGGGAVHNGELETDDEDKRSLGRRLLFRAAVEYGYEVTDEHGVSVVYDHISNGFSSGSNQGLDTVGLRYSYNMVHWTGEEHEGDEPTLNDTQLNEEPYGPVDSIPAPASIAPIPVYVDERVDDAGSDMGIGTGTAVLPAPQKAKKPRGPITIY